MDSWAPATEAEAAMRDVLRAGDQEQYFRILARLELLLPVSSDSAGRRSPGWGTWSTDGRTHVLAFTSSQSMWACLAEHAGSYRTVAFRDLAGQWPNPEWWLAVNPGLPIEGYLPAWFVSQISRGDVRLPGRTMGSRARMDHASSIRARAVAQVPRRPAATGTGTSAASGSSGTRPAVPTVSLGAPASGVAVPGGSGAPVVAQSAMSGQPARSGERAPGLGERIPSERIPGDRSTALTEPAGWNERPTDRSERPAEWGERPAEWGARSPGLVESPAGWTDRQPDRTERIERPGERTERIERPGERTERLAGRAERLAGRAERSQRTPDSDDLGQAVTGELEASLGLGARLTELQAVTGGFAVLPVEASGDDEFVRTRQPDLTAERQARGIWEPRVPGHSPESEPDEETPAQPAPPAAPTSAEFPPAEPARSTQPTRVEPEPPEEEPVDFGGYEPANSTEEELLVASRTGNTDLFMSTLLLARVLVPGYSGDPGLSPSEEINGGRYLVTFTSVNRLKEHHGEAEIPANTVRFTSLISRWPSDDLGFAVNPGTPVGATLSGDEIRTLANWAAEVGLIGDRERDEPEPVAPAPEPAPAPQPQARPAPETPPNQPLLMQRTIAAAQVPLYLERGYDRVSGFVHRASELAHLRTPEELYRALGLTSSGSPFRLDDAEVYVLRWPAYCPSLYRIPFGGQNEAGMQAMQGWVIERGPFRGNGFAPSETSDVIAEFKVDSTRLPHGAQLWRVTRDGTETLIAMYDADGARWRRIGVD